MTKPLNESIRADLNKILESVDLEATPPKDDLNTAFGYEKRPRQLDEDAKPVAQIKTKEFLEWFYDSSEDKTDLAQKIINNLELHGTVSMSIDDVFKNTHYIPTEYIENYDEVKDGLTDEQLLQALKEKEIDNPSEVFDVRWVK